MYHALPSDSVYQVSFPRNEVSMAKGPKGALLDGATLLDAPLVYSTLQNKNNDTKH